MKWNAQTAPCLDASAAPPVQQTSTEKRKKPARPGEITRSQGSAGLLACPAREDAERGTPFRVDMEGSPMWQALCPGARATCGAPGEHIYTQALAECPTDAKDHPALPEMACAGHFNGIFLGGCAILRNWRITPRSAAPGGRV